MRILLSFLIWFLVINNCIAQNEINFLTFNIRYNTESDSLNAWRFRKDKVVAQIRFLKADIFGVQEALKGQIDYLQSAFTEYSYEGVGRDDGRDRGEYSAIFYNKRKFRLIRGETCWLSETSHVPGSRGWDAAHTRIVSWVNLEDQMSGQSLFVFNTHFDHVGKIARHESALLLLNIVDSIAAGAPAIVMGDFNASPTDESIRILTDEKRSNRLFDTNSFSQEPHYGPNGTFNAFGPKEVSDSPIDYIFFKSNNVKVLQHATISESWNGRFASDHFAVFAKVLFTGK